MNQQPNKLYAVFAGAFVMSLISLFPIVNLINVICCAGIMIGGFTGVYLYNKECIKLNAPLEYRDGVFIGLLAGILSGVIVTGINVLVMMFSDTNPINEMYMLMERFGLSSTPEVDDLMNRFSDEFDQFGFSPTISIITLVMYMIIYPLFGMIGSLIAVSVFNKKRQQTI